MTTVNTQVNVDFKDKLTGETGEPVYSCSLSLSAESEDNGGSNPEVGKTYKLRLFEGADLSNVVIFGTGGAVSRGPEGTAPVGVDEPVYLTLTGGRVASLPSPATGTVTIEEWGTIYRSNGSVATGTSYTPVGESQISVPENLYGVLKVSYTTYYTEVHVTSSIEGTVVVVAVGTCADGKIVSTNTSLIFVAPGEGDEEAEEDTYSCGLSLELNSDDNSDSSEYRVGGTYYARVYKGSDITSLVAINNNGDLSLSSSDLSGTIGDLESTDNDDKIFVSFEGSKTASLPYPYSSGLQYEVIGTFYDSGGNATGMPTITADESNLIASKACYGAVRVSYVTKYDKYTFNINEEGKTVLAVIASSCGGGRVSSSTSFEALEAESSSCCCSCSSCDSCDSSSASALTDLTVVYKDIVTGAVLPGAQVSLEGVVQGVTDESGQITIKGVRVNKAHRIRATKVGYLNTDSDSLANDEFIIRES